MVQRSSWMASLLGAAAVAMSVEPATVGHEAKQVEVLVKYTGATFVA